MFGAYWPLLHSISRSVRPVGCVFFTATWFATYQWGIKSFLLQRLQGSLNNTAQPLAAKYQIKTPKPQNPNFEKKLFFGFKILFK